MICMYDVILFFVATFFALLSYLLYEKYSHYKKAFKNEKSNKSSLAVKHGMVIEDLLPWTKHFPGNPKDFRFLGSPIDGVHFGQDHVTFMEFKTGNSKLNGNQRRVKDLIKNGKVKWEEIRVD